MLRLTNWSIVQQIVKPPPHARTVHITPGFLASKVKARMEQPIPRNRSPSQEFGHIDKKPRLETGSDKPSIAIPTHNGTPLAPVQTAECSKPKPKEQQQKKQKKSRKRKSKHELPDPCSAEDVISRDVFALLGEEADKAVEEGRDWESPFEQKTELEVVVSELSSSGTRVYSGSCAHN